MSTGPLTNAAAVSAGVKVGLGPSPNVGRRPTPQQEDEDTGEEPPPTLRISLGFPGPDDPETEGVPPAMSAAPWKSNLPPDLRDALPTALEHSMTDLVNSPDTIVIVGWKMLTPGKGASGRSAPRATTKRLRGQTSCQPSMLIQPSPLTVCRACWVSTYLRNRWLQEQPNPTASATAADLFDHYLEEAVDHAGPELATAAAQAFANLPDPLDRHAGNSGHTYEPETSALSTGPAKAVRAWWEWAKSSWAARFGARAATKRLWR